MILFGVAVVVILVLLCVAQLVATPPPQPRAYAPPVPQKTAAQPKYATVLFEYPVTKCQPTQTPWRDTP